MWRDGRCAVRIIVAAATPPRMQLACTPCARCNGLPCVGGGPAGPAGRPALCHQACRCDAVQYAWWGSVKNPPCPHSHSRAVLLLALLLPLPLLLLLLLPSSFSLPRAPLKKRCNGVHLQGPPVVALHAALPAGCPTHTLQSLRCWPPAVSVSARLCGAWRQGAVPN